MRLYVVAALLLALATPARAADDIGAAARGVVRVIVASEDYSDEENASVTFGSGFAISPHHVVTNAHVVEASQNAYLNSIVAIVPSEGSKALRGTVIAYDPSRDLAVIDVGATRLEPLAIYSGSADSGEHAAALGYPGNVDRATANSMYDLISPTAPVRSEGNVSSQRSVDGIPALLHTAAISRGNSGGPLVDSCGRVLGVNTYTAVTDSGDAPFGFAVVSQELMSFLREHGEQYQQVGSPCVSMADLAQREQSAREADNRKQAIAAQNAEAEQQKRLEIAKSAAEDSRENHSVTAALLALMAVIAGAIGAVLLAKDRVRSSAASGLIAALGLAGGAYAFMSRPSLDVSVPTMTTAAAAEPATVAGKLLCQVKPELSRITVSSTDDLPIEWKSNGCMNGRTQYVAKGDSWRRVLVPNGSETVFVQDFKPAEAQYISTRYLLPQTEMARLRSLRGSSQAKSCSSDPNVLQKLQDVTDQVVASLPNDANEKIVYRCIKSK